MKYFCYYCHNFSFFITFAIATPINSVLDVGSTWTLTVDIYIKIDSFVTIDIGTTFDSSIDINFLLSLMFDKFHTLFSSFHSQFEFISRSLSWISYGQEYLLLCVLP